jgi:hypothetical protein
MTRQLVIFIGLSLLLGAGCSDEKKPNPDSKIVADGPQKVDGGNKTCGTTAHLPANGKVGDYQQSQAPEVATNSQQLFDLIDGGAEKYLQNKFVCMTKAKYASAAKSINIDVWLFDQTDAAGATAAMTAATSAGETPTAPVIGDASVENLGLTFGYQATMRKGKYLARVITEKKEGKDDALALLTQIAGAL